MLSDTDLRDWLENLANTNAARRKIIDDLLRHKGEDHMTSSDVADCHKALLIMDGEAVPERPGPKHISDALIEAEVEH